MIALFNNPKFQVVMMLWASFMALDNARRGDALMSMLMIACSAFWMFRVWGGLRSQKQGERQS